jgi:hypothetical protein
LHCAATVAVADLETMADGSQHADHRILTLDISVDVMLDTSSF